MPTIALLGIAALGAFLRLYDLASRALWYDDITSLAIAAKSLPFIVCQYPAYKSAYILLLKLWTDTFGVSVIAVKMLPAVSGIASIFLVFRIGKDVCNARVGLIASFLLSISCFHIYHSREVKQYTLLACVILLSLFFFIKFIFERKTKFLVANSLLNAAIAFVHPFGFSLVLVQIAHMLFQRRLIGKADLKKWFFVQAPLLCVWCAVIFGARSHLQAVLWWVSRPDIASLTETFRTFCYGAHYGLSDVTVQPYPVLVTGVLSVLLGLFFVRGLFVVFARSPHSHMQLYVTWLFLPLALTFLFSHIFFRVYVIKHLLILLPAFYYITAIGLWYKIRTRFIVIVLLIIFAFNIVPLRIMYNAYAGPDWGKAVQLIKAHHVQDDDVIVLSTTKEIVCLMYYLNDANKEALRDFGIFGKFTGGEWQSSFRYKTHDIITLGSELPGTYDARYNPCYHIDAEFTSQVLHSRLLKADKRIWLLISRWSGGEYDQEGVARKLQDHFKMAWREEAPGVKIYLFEPAMAGI
jgi:mannosyltransferase